MDKVNNERVIIYCKELLTGDELIQVIHYYKLEKMLVEKIESRTLFDEEQFDIKLGMMRRKPKGIEYMYIFVDKAVLNNANNTK